MKIMLSHTLDTLEKCIYTNVHFFFYNKSQKRMAQYDVCKQSPFVTLIECNA